MVAAQTAEMTNPLFFGNFFSSGGSQTETLLLKCRAFQDNNPVVTQLELSEQRMLHPIQGRRQAVRQQVLILPCVGSNPAAPAIFFTHPGYPQPTGTARVQDDGLYGER